MKRDELLADLRQAYYDARRHKSKKPYLRLFEARLEQNLQELCEELWTRTYKPRPSTCFLISDPKRREVFAANFRDRIVHHLYYNYTHELLERTFIYDSYSCIKGRGTHFGIARLEHHVLRESLNYSQPCYVLKMDIKGYFMHINRQRLLDITLHQLKRHQRQLGTSLTDFLEYLSREIILLDPTDGCIVKGNKDEWKNLPKEKSLFCSPDGCGLPIGNLTSQLFSNVYLNVLDQYMKRTLGCKHYGRYVDDFFVVSCDRQWLRDLIPKVRDYLREELALQLHEGKIRIYDVRFGVDFLGAYLKPYRRYLCNATLRRIRQKLPSLEQEDNPERLRARINSFLGITGHYRSLQLQKKLLITLKTPWQYGCYIITARGLKFVLSSS